MGKAIITHGHADHARWGSQQYLCHQLTVPILKARLGSAIVAEGLAYGQKVTINGVAITLHPAGHIVGSAQVRVSYKGEVWVASGDYKTEPDGISGTFEPVPCHTFITECTFGLPVYQWPQQAQVFAAMNHWWAANRAQGVTSVVACYSLGKAQRILKHLDASIGPVLAHGAIANMNAVVQQAGVVLPAAQQLVRDTPKATIKGAMVLAPPSALGSAWMKKLQPHSLGIASGWMALRGTRRRRAADRGFVLSDHADWAGLNAAITATGAQRVIATHGYQAAFARWLTEQGIEAHEEQTLFEGEQVDGTGAEAAAAPHQP